jgi:hypothetical protein
MAAAAAVGLVLAGCGTHVASAPAARTAATHVVRAPMEDVFTPVTVRPVNAGTVPVHGTDGRYHVVYELELTNSKLATATIQRIQVVDAKHTSHVIASYSGQALVGRLRTLLPAPADNAKIEPNGGRFFYIELSFRHLSDVPHRVLHRIDLLGAGDPGATTPSPLHYTVAPYNLRDGHIPVLGPPLAGKGWVAANGCCNPDIIHRGSIQTVNGDFFDSQRFAIDWMRLDKQGRFVHGDPSVPANYTDFHAKVMAVADGTVVSTVDGLPNQVPGQLPPPSSLTLKTVDGNNVVLDIGHGLFVLFAHLQKGSLTVHPGQRVHRGQVLGLLGNSGNTSAPHLHVHLMTGPSTFSSDGVPYVYSNFAFAGQVSIAQFNAAPDLTGFWGQGRLKHPQPRHDQFPLNLNIINFPN